MESTTHIKAFAIISVALVMMSACVMIIPAASDDVDAATAGSTYRVGLVEGSSYSYKPTYNLSNVTTTLSGTAADWLTITNGTISGTAPSVSASGGTSSYDLTIKATTTNPYQEAYQYISFTIYDTLTVSGSATSVKTYVGGSVNVASNSNFSDSHVWSMTGAPKGISINSSTGVISGTPTEAGTKTATITGKHSASGQVKTYTVTFNVTGVLSVTSASDMYAINGVELPIDSTHPNYYKLTSNFSGITFALSKGTISGVTVNSDGTITGTPASMGDIVLTITATDGSTGQTVSFDLTVHIVSKLSFDSVPTGGIVVEGA